MELLEKTLILIRHAHRDTSERDLDNGLSKKGMIQARNLAKKFERLSVTEPVLLLSSPKLRCIQTLDPIAKLSQVPIEKNALLIEKDESERMSHLQARVDHFLNIWKKSKSPITLVCSHGDWLPLAFQGLLGIEAEFKKGSWAEISWNGFKPLLRFRN
jgi:broad specificity phosphatase PhoE